MSGATADGVLAAYLADVRTRGFDDDPAQRRVAAVLDRIRDELAQQRRPRFSLRRRARTPVTGAYLWGDVGRGKTYLMDLFYEQVRGRRKMRQHFHRFMQRVHGELRSLRDQRDPLLTVAGRLADRHDLICFDEFFVSDIADAMLLGTLFTALFERGVTLVATSNVHPDDLYRDGLQRSRFLPAIEQIKTHCEIVEADGPSDYRLRVLQEARVYHTPLGEATRRRMREYFERIAPGHRQGAGQMTIAGRAIPYCRRADGVAWFGFDALCRGPRGTADYIELARCFGTVILSDVPVLTSATENEARRFIALVDEFYDRRVKLILSAAAPLDALYKGEKLAFEFARTTSRLREMGSDEYLALPHRP